ncbi:MAG: FHA domain-containing protein [Aggregatilineales bacterium]|nr:FHA domain-containing protein [Chloroflexota bacterium]HOA22789.1 FHA domain-containing protein [Aggregatilineales bacterium]HQE17656.1 FHA domain-containing protein [Aggregatilineales bacterium]
MPSDKETRYLDEETFIVSQQEDRINTIFERFLMYYTPFGFQTRVDDVVYHALPYKPGPDDNLLLREPWRVRLELYVQQKPMHLGLDLYGDVVLGRGKSKPGLIVVDLDEYNALELGVSRQHLLLRPTARHLFAIDQGSTNGTTINSMPLGRGMARALADEDLINLGNMVLMIHIVKRPNPETAGTTSPLKMLSEQALAGNASPQNGPDEQKPESE